MTDIIMAGWGEKKEIKEGTAKENSTNVLKKGGNININCR